MMMMIRNIGILLKLWHTFRQQVYISSNVVGQVQQRKTAKYTAGCIFSQTYCILVKVHSFGEQMVFQHGPICSSAEGRVFVGFFCWFFFNFKPYYRFKDSYQQASEELCWLNERQNYTKKRRQLIF